MYVWLQNKTNFMDVKGTFITCERRHKNILAQAAG